MHNEENEGTHSKFGSEEYVTKIDRSCDFWSDSATSFMLDKLESYLANIGPMKRFKTKKQMWLQISKDMAEMLNVSKTPTQIENRYKTVLKRKKKAIENNSKSGSSREEVQMVRKSNVTQRGTESMKCYNCNQLGHMSSRCPFAEQGWSFCYYCNKMAQHKGPNCPKRTSDGVGNSRSKTNVLKNKNTEAKGKTEKEAKGYTGAKGGRVEKSKKSQNSKKLNRFKKDNRSQQEKADSGATEHIVKSNLILREFKRTEKGVIRSANKDRKADIKIDGKGDLYIHAENSELNKIRLTNVLAAEEISENLISLRKFAEA
ncbi:PREDICTED: uncharacterized protein LOC105458153, partial [Wasmannia auropunctata]|uniref:uncharacterized protein LOC105458153 n=1 Tax=Wasmannia auropunctata TaxID=64793 RepID=UPI0005ED8F7D